MTCLVYFLLFLAGLTVFGLLFGPFIGGCLGLVISGGLFKHAWSEARKEAKGEADELGESDG